MKPYAFYLLGHKYIKKFSSMYILLLSQTKNQLMFTILEFRIEVL